MVPKLWLFVILALCALADKATAEECRPQSVVDMTLDAHHILSWAVREDEECEINQFLVNIYESGQPIQYSFQVEETQVDVSFLQVCHAWVFSVIPVSNHTNGREHILYGNIPLPADADISIAYINVSRHEEGDEAGDLHLLWDLSDTQYGSCSIRYRLTIEEFGSSSIMDLYFSENSVNLHFLSPCTTYQFGVRAINIAHPTVEGPLKTLFYSIPPTVQEAPTVIGVEQGVTSFNLTWGIQSFVRNRCEVTEFHVDGKQWFNLTIPIEDSPERTPVGINIVSLLPNSMYYLRGYVKNSGGWSGPTVVAVQTLEVSPDKGLE